jgi:large subunit ribosomal protein L27
MAHTKAIGTTQLGRDSRPKYRGVKLFDGQPAKAGSIVVRQTGSSFIAGAGIRTGSDYTLYAVRTGTVKYRTVKKAGFNGKRRIVKVVSVV